MILAGSFPTPYGVSVPVHKVNEGDEDFVFSADAVAICGGIHDPAQRARFVADVKAAGSMNMDRFGDYGGRQLPHIPLPRPSSPVTPGLPKGFEPDIPLTAWTNAALDHSRWCDRAEALNEAIDSNFALHQEDSSFRPILVLGLQILLTAALEHLTETKVDCLEAAAFYAMSTHPEWSEAALRWLEPVAETWWRDWIRKRPAIAAIGERADLPSWFGGGA